MTAVTRQSWLILYRNCTTNVLPVRCLNGHRAKLRPCLSGLCGQGRRRYNLRTLHGRSRMSGPARQSSCSTVSAFLLVIVIRGILSDDEDLLPGARQA